VRLGDYFGKRPAILSLVYYNCPMLCSEEMDGIASALEMVRLTPGKDFEIILISIDPSETPEIAAKKKAFYLKRYGAGDGQWMALPHREAAGHRRSLQRHRLRYVRVPGRTESWISSRTQARSSGDHRWPPGAVLPRRGVLAKDILLGLIEASATRSARRSPHPHLLLPLRSADEQALADRGACVQLGGMMTVVSLGSFMFVMFRRDIQLGRNHDLTSKRTDDEG